MNIKDVAELAGVSPATVSRYINQSPKVSEDAASKIQRVLDITGYDCKKDKVKRFELKRNPVIGVMIPSLLNPVFSEIVAGIQARAKHFGLSILVVDTQYDQEQERQAILDLIRQRVEGVILTVSSTEKNKNLDVLSDFRFPYCLVHNQVQGDEPCVYIDNYQAGWDVAAKLLALGHKHLGVITGTLMTSDRAQKRYEGFRDCLDLQKVAIREFYQVDQASVNPFQQNQIQALQGKGAPTAWFCSNDLLALKLINVLRSKKINVPEDVSVVGFDGMEIAQLAMGTLATVKVPHLQMGRIAVDVICNLKAGLSLPYNVKLDYQLDLSGTVDRAQNN